MLTDHIGVHGLLLHMETLTEPVPAIVSALAPSRSRPESAGGVSRGDVGRVRCRTPCRQRGCSPGGGPGSAGPLDVSEVGASIEHGREESVTERAGRVLMT